MVRILNYFLPKEADFFTLFVDHAKEIEHGARALHALFSDVGHVEKYVTTITGHEHSADEITHEVTSLLHSTFITPFDRDQILLLITKMDDVLDLTKDVAQSISLYNVKHIRPEAQELEEVCLASALKVQEVVGKLSHTKHAPEIFKLSKEIKRLESKADDIMRTGIAKLFREEKDPRELIRAKEIYELLETVTDRCDDVADIAQGVILESA